MAVNFKDGYTVPSHVREMYPDLEKNLLPLIKRRAQQMRHAIPGIDVEDAIQEGRLALLSCLTRYDANKCSFDLKRYVSKTLRNTYAMMLYEALAQRRTPRAHIQDGEGNWGVAPRVPISLDEMLTYEPVEGDLSPEARIIEMERLSSCIRIKMKMMEMLTGRDLDVFKSMLETSCEFLEPEEIRRIIIREEQRKQTGEPLKHDGCLAAVDAAGGDVNSLSNILVANYLNINKNMIDWSINKIRMLFSKLVKQEEVEAPNVLEAMEKRGLPAIQVNRGTHFSASFVRSVMTVRNLRDEEPHIEIQSASHRGCTNYWMRRIERHTWGAVLVLKRGGEFVTAVIEGRLNLLTGDVFSLELGGARDKLPVEWYQQLSRRLSEVYGGQENTDATLRRAV